MLTWRAARGSGLVCSIARGRWPGGTRTGDTARRRSSASPRQRTAAGRRKIRGGVLILTVSFVVVGSCVVLSNEGSKLELDIC